MPTLSPLQFLTEVNGKPPKPILWTAHRRELVSTLSLRVRFLSSEQIRDHWWSPSETGKRECRRQLSALVAAGYLRRHRLSARTFLLDPCPLVDWQSGAPAPDFGAVAYQLRERWTAPVRALTVVTATERATTLFGGVAQGIVFPDTASHDLGLAAVYLQLLRTAPELARTWVSEERLLVLRRHAHDAHPIHAQLEKMPDAALLDDAGAITCLIEFGGRYDKARVERTHRHAASLGLRYQLW